MSFKTVPAITWGSWRFPGPTLGISFSSGYVAFLSWYRGDALAARLFEVNPSYNENRLAEIRDLANRIECNRSAFEWHKRGLTGRLIRWFLPQFSHFFGLPAEDILRCLRNEHMQLSMNVERDRAPYGNRVPIYDIRDHWLYYSSHRRRGRAGWMGAMSPNAQDQSVLQDCDELMV